GDLWRRHMLDSAQLYPLLPPVPGGSSRVVVDLGSGAGFPGLVLAVMGGGQVHLIEADRKKAEFLREAARVAGATVSIHAQRIEDAAPIPAHAVTARALAPLPRLLAYASPFLSAPPDTSGDGGGIALFLKGRTLDRELTDSAPVWTMDAEILPSRTEPAGRILRLRRLQRRKPRT
ncbi:MAG: 16S rRNA (guanine(527)-N(7))-methyltransferase RsmG, partial [Kiloniellaceae bacterium]